MKRIVSYLVLMLTAASCTVDHKNDYDPQMQLEFHPVMYVPTKADAEAEVYPEGQPFAVSAWTLDKIYNWEVNAGEATKYLLNEPVLFSDNNGWNIECGALWPEKGQKMTVIGYTPVEAFDASTSEQGATCHYNMLTSQDDLLYTDPQTDMDKVENYGVIVLPFKHALAQVDFRVKSRVLQNEEIIIKSIKIDEVKHKGNFTSLPQPTWQVEDAETSLVFFEGEQATRNTPAAIGRTWNVIPQNFSTKVTVEYEYRTAANTGFTLTLKTCELETKIISGRNYTYTLSVGIDDVKFLLEIIEDRFI